MNIKSEEYTKTMMDWLIATGRCSSEFLAKLLFPAQTEANIKMQNLKDERLDWLKKFAHYLEYSKTAPTKKQQAEFLEKKYQFLLEFARVLVHDDIAMHENHYQEMEKELECLRFQPYN